MTDLEFINQVSDNNVTDDQNQPVSGVTKPGTTPIKKNPKKKLVVAIIILVILFLSGLEIYIYSRKDSAEDKQSTNPTLISQAESTLTLAPEKESQSDEEKKDTDGDGYLDEEEIATGYDPLINDCLDQYGCQLEQEFKNSKALNVLFILDASGSMAGLVSGQAKIEIAKQAIKDYVEELGDQVNFGLTVYGHIGSNSESDKQLSCSKPELLYSVGKPDKEKFNQVIDSFSPVGWTPIAGSLTQAQNQAFVDKEGENNKIILISDGIETCDGNPCQVAEQLKESKIETIIDVIGFGVDQQAKTQLECIANVTGGVYQDARNAEEFRQAMGLIKANLQQAIGYSQCLIQNGLKISQCKIQKASTISKYRLQKAREN